MEEEVEEEEVRCLDLTSYQLHDLGEVEIPESIEELDLTANRLSKLDPANYSGMLWMRSFCNIAHALEKTKYPDSDIYWKKFEEKYHFSCQFNVDLIAMNNADFIITSTYQEIGERHDDIRLETDDYACLPLCSFAHACEGRSPQAGTSEIAIATYACPCGIGRQNGMPWGKLIPRVGMLTTTGPLGTAQTGLPLCRAFHPGRGSRSRERHRFELDSRESCFRHMAGLDTHRAAFRRVPGYDT
uniref:sucrose synthase n=1 Tax=Ananas comosus var. bracteatus TaxID=296719 RepID=A0A6V7NYB0_ANACO|nr:unnamed protein product [Ananas comosus var. bracteatus]